MISVSDKLALADFAHCLVSSGIEIYSTGGTGRYLESQGIAVHEVSAYTGFPEMMDGRLKTLHPKIFGADNARAASPFFDMGNPSITVAWELAVPGMPMRTDGKVSDVAVTDCSPIIMARAIDGSIPNRNGRISARPAVPPRPGRIPTARPRNTPPASDATCNGLSSVESADRIVSRMMRLFG